MLNRAVFSSASDHWSTPTHVYEALHEEFKFEYDPCPLMSSESGLLKDWKGRVFCNPPYSAIDAFLRKGLGELAEGNVTLLVYLIPSRTDTRWFHDYCIKAREIRFLRGRLRFGDAKNCAPFPSMLVIFDKWELPKMEIAA